MVGMLSNNSRSPRELVTAKDVARVAGVSTATVCLSMRDDRRVNARTRTRVQAICRDMNYRPNANARALVRGRTHSLGVVFSALEFEKTVLISVYSRALEILADRFAGQDHYLSVATWSVSSDEQSGTKLPRMFYESGVEGMIVIQSPGQELAQVLDSQNVPYVVLDGLTAASRNACSVYVDECRAAELAVEHLVSMGHRRIANLTTLPKREFGIVSPSPSHRILEFPRGYARAMSNAGLPAIPGWDQPMHLFEHLAKLWSRPEAPTALVVYDDQSAGNAMKWLAQRGISVPRDISIVALHDIGYAAIDWLPVPAITCIANMQEQMALVAAEKLMRLIAQTPGGDASVCLEPKLVIRGTTQQVAQGLSADQ